MACSTHRVLRWIMASIMYASVLLGVSELFLRLVVVHGLGRPPVLRYDPVLGWANTGGLRVERPRRDGGRWRVTLDAGGRRVVSPATDPALPHVVALGDSFTFGDSIDEDDHFLHFLSGRVGVNVHNLGVVGYATDQEFLAFKHATEPCDLLLIMTYTGNDLRDNLSSFETGGLRFKPKMAVVENVLIAQPLAHPALAWARAHSYLTTMALTGLYRFWPDLPLFDPVRLSERREESIHLYVALLQQILDEAARRGVKRTLVVVWSFRSVGDSQELIARVRAAIGDGAIVVDLDREFARRETDPAALYFSPAIDPGEHWNERGHALLGEILGDVVGAEAERRGPRQ